MAPSQTAWNYLMELTAAINEIGRQRLRGDHNNLIRKNAVYMFTLVQRF